MPRMHPTPPRHMRQALLLGLALVFAMALLPAATLAKPARVRMVVVVLDAVSARELSLAHTPFLHAMAAKASLGLMNTRTAMAAPTSPTSFYLTLGAGAKAADYTNAAYMGADPEEVLEERPASEVFRARTGAELKPGNVGALELAGLLLSNTDADLGKLKATPGALGDALHAAGLKTAALGSADVPGFWRRHITTLAMDSKGLVDYGDVSPRLTVRDPGAPSGFATDYRRLLASFDTVSREADFCAIELGDSSRVEALSTHLTADTLLAQRLLAIQHADAFLSQLTRRIDLRHTALMVVVPSPSTQASLAGDRLTPIWALGRGFTQGLLVSPSTRWPGVVQNTDISATVLDAFGLAPSEGMVGRPMTTVKRAESVDDMVGELVRADDDLTRLNQQRATVLRVFTTTQIAFLIVVGLALLPWWPRTAGPRLRTIAGQGSVYMVAVPLALLMQGALPAWGMAANVVAVALMSAGIGLAALRATRGVPQGAVTLVCWALVTATIVDQLTGQRLAHYSLLSYNPVVGARFYGLGNEYMGALVGATLVGGLSLPGIRGFAHATPRGLAALGALFAAVFVVTGHPAIGANFGGAVACAVGLGASWYLVTERRVTWRAAVLIAVAAALVLAAVVSIDLMRGGAASHVGRLLRSIERDGPKELYYVIVRKVAMNVRLVRRTIWSRLLLAMFAPLAAAIMFRRQWLSRFWLSDGLACRVLVGSLVAALVAFAANDSGVVAADTLLTFPVALFVVELLRADEGGGS